jgi:Putative  PD-(D/E)XK family member, (DUF4420)
LHRQRKDDPDAITPQQWAQLRATRPISEDSLVTIPFTVDGVDTPLSMAMDQPGHLHLLIPVERGPTGQKPSDLNGLKVRHRRLETGEVIDLAPPSHERVFTPFCRDVVNAVIVQRREPWAAVIATVRDWQSAWKPLRQEMSAAVQVGLFGELLALNALMFPCIGPAAVDQRSGPNSERHDFVGDQLHLEVKTTRRTRSEHEISRLNQLSAPVGCRLLFISVQVEQSIGGSQTVATQIDANVQALRSYPATLDDFMAKLASVGWSEEMRHTLLSQEALSSVMPIADNIEYIRSQKKMFEDILSREERENTSRGPPRLVWRDPISLGATP